METRAHPYSPSDFMDDTGSIAKEMTLAEIKQVVKDFGSAAEICKRCSADAVEIHAAHGYLLSQFLSPYYNKRNDKYGGSIENRFRIVEEVYLSIRAHVGKDFPIMIKLNYEDLVQPGFIGDECVFVCKRLEELGINGIEISSGLAISPISLPFQKPNNPMSGTFTNGALEVASKVNVPVISVGGYRSLDGIEAVLNEGNISAFSVSRPLICEPDLISKWLKGDTRISKCISCNKCFLGVYGCKVFHNN